MESIWTVLGIFVGGVIFGIGVMRYAMGCQLKSFYQIKEDFPVTQWGKPIDQDVTGIPEEDE